MKLSLETSNSPNTKNKYSPESLNLKDESMFDDQPLRDAANFPNQFHTLDSS